MNKCLAHDFTGTCNTMPVFINFPIPLLQAENEEKRKTHILSPRKQVSNLL